MRTFPQKLQTVLDDWRNRELIDAEVHRQLSDDVAQRYETRSFASIVAILGAVLLTAAVIAFVASNWEDMSRLSRLVLLIGALWATYLAAFDMHRRGHTSLRETLLIVATALFGGTIMLIGQMFHLQGDVRDALVLWFAGSVVLTLATRSVSVLVCSTLISIAWLITVGLDVTAVSEGDRHHYGYPVLWLICAGLTYGLKSRLAAHGLALAMLAWQFVLLAVHSDNPAHIFWLLFSLDLVLAAALLFSRETRRFLSGFEDAALVYTFVAINSAAILLMAILLDGSVNVRLIAASALIWPSLAVLATAGLCWLAKRQLQRPGRDHAVIALAAGLATVLLGVAVLTGHAEDDFAGTFMGLVSALYAFFVAIWTVRFGWRLELRSLSGVGFLAFIVTLLVSYSVLFGSLQMTAAVYGLGGVALVAFSIWLAKREKPEQDELP